MSTHIDEANMATATLRLKDQESCRLALEVNNANRPHPWSQEAGPHAGVTLVQYHWGKRMWKWYDYHDPRTYEWSMFTNNDGINGKPLLLGLWRVSREDDIEKIILFQIYENRPERLEIGRLEYWPKHSQEYIVEVGDELNENRLKRYGNKRK